MLIIWAPAITLHAFLEVKPERSGWWLMVSGSWVLIAMISWTQWRRKAPLVRIDADGGKNRK